MEIIAESVFQILVEFLLDAGGSAVASATLMAALTRWSI
ncbi:MAG: hypothetical protein QOG65_1696 [Actinomycetota bacterium]|jgi:hypothetical protein|nr:hypothetical protein [Actinomycetota bacterium]MDQ1384317.1 hypothetical protein [Actinomycetota bacterium]